MPKEIVLSEYRFDATVSICFSIYSTSREDAEKRAKEFLESFEMGCDVGLADAHSTILYSNPEDEPAEVIDVNELDETDPFWDTEEGEQYK